jgi:glutathione S-transferase
MLQLLGKSTSINVRKVLWTCAELGLQVEREDWGSGFRSTETAEFRRLNPNALVPVLIEDDFVLWESNSICRYLAASRRRDDLLPQSARERALVEHWMDWQATELNNAWRYVFMGLVRQSPAHADPDLLRQGVDNWARHMRMLEDQLQVTGAYAAGATFSLADVVLGLSVNRWFMTPCEKPDLPAVNAYYERLGQRDGFREHGNNGVP